MALAMAGARPAAATAAFPVSHQAQRLDLRAIQPRPPYLGPTPVVPLERAVCVRPKRLDAFDLASRPHRRRARVELLCGAQGLDLRLEQGETPGGGTRLTWQRVRQHVDRWIEDRELHPDLSALGEAVRAGAFARS